MSNNSYKYTDKKMLAIATAILVVVTTIFVMFDKYLLPMFVDSLTPTKSSAVTSTISKTTNFDIHHLYQLPDGRKISVGYYNTNTYVSIPADAQHVSHVAVWSEESLLAAPSRGALRLRVYPSNTTVFNEANSTVLRFNYPMKNAKEWDEPILVYTDDLRKWLEDISSSQQN